MPYFIYYIHNALAIRFLSKTFMVCLNSLMIVVIIISHILNFSVLSSCDNLKSDFLMELGSLWRENRLNRQNYEIPISWKVNEISTYELTI